jgi:hypothetical protein
LAFFIGVFPCFYSYLSLKSKFAGRKSLMVIQIGLEVAP